MSTHEQRQQWRELAEEATPVANLIPDVTLSSAHVNAQMGVNKVQIMNLITYVIRLQNQYRGFAVAVPQLLADVDALTAERDALAAELERVRAQLVHVTRRHLDDEGANSELVGWNTPPQA